MDEQNKQPEQQPEQQPACEKKLSRTTLTFYIVGLFSVAIALILISYVAQARADRQLDTLTDQLTEQQTVAQGATQKVEDLQKQYDAQQRLIGSVEQALEKDAVLAETEDEDLAAAAGRIAARSGALSQLVRVQDALADGDYETAAQLYDALVKEYTEPVLARTGEDASLWLLTEEEAQIFSDVQEQIEQTR